MLDQLEGLKDLACRAMFGGYGLYRGQVFFGIIWKSRLYFKTDSRTRPDYTERGMRPFRPRPRQGLARYYEVPVDILENRDLLARWALRAVGAAMPPESRRANPDRRR